MEEPGPADTIGVFIPSRFAGWGWSCHSSVLSFDDEFDLSLLIVLP